MGGEAMILRRLQLDPGLHPPEAERVPDEGAWRYTEQERKRADEAEDWALEAEADAFRYREALERIESGAAEGSERWIARQALAGDDFDQTIPDSEFIGQGDEDGR
jgi:hypothetical protein